ncbi:MAG: SDR family oxidoreductase [Bacteroidota bacterium]
MIKNYFYQFVQQYDWNFPTLKTVFDNTKNNPYDEQDTNEERSISWFHNKVVVVTGASSGIGRAIAMECATNGANVVLAARNESKLFSLRDEINKANGLAHVIPTDVSEEDQCRALIDTTLKLFGRIDILVNNAGISMRANFLDLDLSVLKKLMDTNFWGAVYCTKYALPEIIKTKGSVVGISSISGITPLPGRTGYVASKHALDGFLETIRVENMEKDVHVMLVHPGFTTSNIRNVALNKFGLPQVETPLEESKLMPAERVAKEVVKGILNKKRDIILTTEGKLITWLYRRVPQVAERLIYREMKKEVDAPF